MKAKQRKKEEGDEKHTPHTSVGVQYGGGEEVVPLTLEVALYPVPAYLHRANQVPSETLEDLALWCVNIHSSVYRSLN